MLSHKIRVEKCQNNEAELVLVILIEPVTLHAKYNEEETMEDKIAHKDA